ncbi:MAG: hypothetical protein EOP11_23545, partial [Proteobacteria bacterium]
MIILKLFSLLLAIGAHAETLKYAKFGTVEIFRGEGAPDRLVLFFNEGAGIKSSGEVIKALAEKNTVVASVGKTFHAALLKRAKKSCVYPAGDLEELSKFVQTKLKFKEYRLPILVGFGADAAIAYGAYAQAPRNTFAGAVSVGFCPRWQAAKSFCSDNGLKSTRDKAGFAFAPSGQPLPNWRVLGGGKACESTVKDFVGKVTGAKFTLPSAKLAEEVRASAQEVHVAAAVVSPFKGDATIESLPLVNIDPIGPPKGLVIFYSGDGGWAGFDQGVSAELSRAGNRVVGLSSLKYFWSAKAPELATDDLAKILRYFAKAKDTGPIRLVGYSFGADVMPEMVSRLPESLRAQIKGVSLLGLSDSASFEFHFTDWMNAS